MNSLWKVGKVDKPAVMALVRQLLAALGEDPDREGLQQTPERVANFWQEFIEHNPGKTDTTFEAITTDQMVIMAGLRTWSLCEHHLLPFWCDISIGYIAGDVVLGASKFARVAHKHAHKLQLQERLVDEIAAEIAELAATQDVAVLAVGAHSCMLMRGVQTPGTMITSALRGKFLHVPAVRDEFYDLTSLGSRYRSKIGGGA